MTCKSVNIYGLIDPTTSQIRYVGKTVLDPRRRLSVHCDRALKSPEKTHSMAWIASLHKRGIKPEVFTIETVDGDHWIEAEQFWIAYFRFIGADLCNHTIGGEGQCGYKQPKEVVEKRLKRGV